MLPFSNTYESGWHALVYVTWMKSKQADICQFKGLLTKNGFYTKAWFCIYNRTAKIPKGGRDVTSWKTLFWTDIFIKLYYVQKVNAWFNTFVTKGPTLFRELTRVDQWSYVKRLWSYWSFFSGKLAIWTKEPVDWGENFPSYRCLKCWPRSQNWITQFWAQATHFPFCRTKSVAFPIRLECSELQFRWMLISSN